jgi:hypothetical protein
MGIRGIENLTGADQGYVVHVTEHNHQWVSEMTGLSMDDIALLYARSVEQGVVCTVNVQPDHC